MIPFMGLLESIAIAKAFGKCFFLCCQCGPNDAPCQTVG